jgi:hypothetical protein
MPDDTSIRPFFLSPMTGLEGPNDRTGHPESPVFTGIFSPFSPICPKCPVFAPIERGRNFLRWKSGGVHRGAASPREGADEMKIGLALDREAGPREGG